KIVAPVAAGIVLLGGLTFLAHSNASSEKSKRVAVETQADKLKNQLGHLLQGSTPTGQSANLAAEAASVLGTDVGWTQMLGDLRASLPAGVWLTNLQAQHTLVQPLSSGSASSAGSASSTGGTSPAGRAPPPATAPPPGSAPPAA